MKKAMNTDDQKMERLRVVVRGRVQGVGFRPFVYRTALARGLTGNVMNDPQGVTMEIQGVAENLETFLDDLENQAPSAAHIKELLATSLAPKPEETSFRILKSLDQGAARAGVTPDIATCPDCLRELHDPADRRYRYPFINCMHCGPRYSIIRNVPYDRSNTTMSAFEMCPDCRAEYENPLNRRFHAQPNACPVCGPSLWLADKQGRRLDVDSLSSAAEILEEGRILAIRGIGGFQLACRADDNAAVQSLRQRKERETKPFAIMGPSFDALREIVDCGEEDTAFFRHVRHLLSSPESPIVILPRCDNGRIAPAVAPGNGTLGVMLPYTPLHHLLLEQVPACLVMTSGNPSSEPLCADNDEAIRRLAHIADYFLLHDRDIERRVDDSVLIALDAPHSPVDGVPWTLPLRRARGYVPAPLPLKPAPAGGEVLALGGDMKSAISLTRQGEVLLSEHLGELENPVAYRNFVRTIDNFLDFFDVRPAAVAIDTHPAYISARFGRQWAREHGCDIITVQHHHAHLVGGLAEHGLEDQTAVAITADGTGYGADGAVWGGEILVGNAAGFERVGHIGYYDLPGGDLAARQTWRPAAALLHRLYGSEWKDIVDWKHKGVSDEAVEMLDRRFASNDAPQAPTSSTGRLFDAAAFLLGFCDENLNEAQAPMALESAAMESDKQHFALDPEALLKNREAETFCLNPLPLFEKIVTGLQDGENRTELAWFFHEALATMLARGAIEAARRKSLERVVLSGGCFANRILIGAVSRELRRAGLEVLAHGLVPTGDGGLALGQAAIGLAALK